ncbi:glycosyltransferase family 4 protein [Gilvibacter sediminis]|uniref:glycosyltransferase family 4 protein n=1 Tax=Gilvibacter sediminis TaxID=379071 RepID=UPI0023509461|nr:glycosyltransferase family 4 protein [Gilvibacter sediminis]MDC7999263.1 glycosyltransferase family 4 protein [Gilvibacter sediminis]
MSLKVLFFLKEFPKFSETFIRDQIAALIREGHEVHIYTLKRNGGQLDALKGLEDLQLFEKTQSPGTLLPASKKKRFKAIRNKLKRAANKSHKKALRRSLNVFNFGRSAVNGRLFFLLDYLHENQINVIHAHYGTMGEQAAQLKACGFQGKFFCTFHGFDLRGGLAGKSSFKFPLLKLYADGIFAISHYSEKQLLSMGFSKSQLYYLPNGIALNPSAEIKIPQNTVKFLSVGRLVPEKDYPTAFKALAAFQKRNPELEWKYTVVGQGELAQELKQLVQDLELSSRVEFTGALPSEKVKMAYLQADLFLLSSKVEVLPTVLLEALNAGLCCLSTRVGAVEEILGADGYICPAQQPESFCAEIEKALAEREQWPQKLQKQQQHLVNTYDKAKVVKQLIAYYSG